MSVTEAARVLSCSRGHVYNLIAAGELSVVDIGIEGRPKTRVLEGELKGYVERRTRRATPRTLDSTTNDFDERG
ncbi:helix-turn-helix domain-containing protein [Pimelobacter simplex]|uniref:helix-turn-helix domain-containing protein n=1 Tax=Nocardioides simplex TaxID=2045 RepID=UPI003AAC2E16